MCACVHVRAEEEPEREDALPWEFSSDAMTPYKDEVKSLVLKLSQVRWRCACALGWMCVTLTGCVCVRVWVWCSSQDDQT